MPHIALAIIVGEKPFNKKQPNAPIMDSNNNMLYAPIVTLTSENAAELKTKLGSVVSDLIDKFENTEDKRKDFHTTLTTEDVEPKAK
jgi:hypothetical protein